MTSRLLTERVDFLFMALGSGDVFRCSDFAHERVCLHQGIKLSQLVIDALRIDNCWNQFERGTFAQSEGKETL